MSNKLIDILAREMKEWPDNGTDIVGQACDGSLHLNSAFQENRGHTQECYTLAEDWLSSEVTRKDWEEMRNLSK